MEDFAQGILDDVEKVTKKWAEQNKREIREANARAARRSAFIRARHVTVQDAAWEIMEEADTAGEITIRRQERPVRRIMVGRSRIMILFLSELTSRSDQMFSHWFCI